MRGTAGDDDLVTAAVGQRQLVQHDLVVAHAVAFQVVQQQRQVLVQQLEAVDLAAAAQLVVEEHRGVADEGPGVDDHVVGCQRDLAVLVLVVQHVVHTQEPVVAQQLEVPALRLQVAQPVFATFQRHHRPGFVLRLLDRGVVEAAFDGVDEVDLGPALEEPQQEARLVGRAQLVVQAGADGRQVRGVLLVEGTELVHVFIAQPRQHGGQVLA